MSLSDAFTWNFDIDRYLNPFIPPPPWRHLPYPIAHFFGYRRDKPRELGNLLMIFWAFIGVFCSIILIELATRYLPEIGSNGPVIVASFGAAAVLEFYSIEAPFAQPRNAIISQLLASSIGVSICKLFHRSPDFESIRWLGGALACATTTAITALTKTVHPPAGATALLAVVDNVAIGLGWFLIPLVLVGCVIMLGTALLVNNIQRRFPMYWWTPENLPVTGPILERDLESATESGETFKETPEIIVQRGLVKVPAHIFLTPEEQQVLEILSERI